MWSSLDDEVGKWALRIAGLQRHVSIVVHGWDEGIPCSTARYQVQAIPLLGGTQSACRRVGEDRGFRESLRSDRRAARPERPTANDRLHEKEGRRHANAVWSRIDADTMNAKPLTFFKTKLQEDAQELYPKDMTVYGEVNDV